MIAKSLTLDKPPNTSYFNKESDTCQKGGGLTCRVVVAERKKGNNFSSQKNRRLNLLTPVLNYAIERFNRSANNTNSASNSIGILSS